MFQEHASYQGELRQAAQFEGYAGNTSVRMRDEVFAFEQKGRMTVVFFTSQN